MPGGGLVEMDGLDGLFNLRKVVWGREPTDSDLQLVLGQKVRVGGRP